MNEKNNTLTDSRETSNDKGYKRSKGKFTAPLAVDVLPAKVAQTSRREETIVRSNVVHVVHETEGSVGQDCGIALQVWDGTVSERPDIVHAGLVTAVEVLASELGDTDGFPKTGPLLDIGLEV